jgi:hypothetical protein
MGTTTARDAVVSPAPVPRRAFVATVGGGVLGLATALPIFGGSAASAAPAEPVVVSAKLADWSLTVVRSSVALDLTADALSRFEVTTRVVRRAGTAAASYSGVALVDLFAAVGAGSGARALVLSSALTGEQTVTSVLTPFEVRSRALVATTLNGRALSADEGAPARLITARSATGNAFASSGRVLRIDVLG